VDHEAGATQLGDPDRPWSLVSDEDFRRRARHAPTRTRGKVSRNQAE
jgi:hypothetical protein